jgi:hypothetical protein
LASIAVKLEQFFLGQASLFHVADGDVMAAERLQRFVATKSSDSATIVFSTVFGPATDCEEPTAGPRTLESRPRLFLDLNLTQASGNAASARLLRAMYVRAGRWGERPALFMRKQPGRSESATPHRRLAGNPP